MSAAVKAKPKRARRCGNCERLRIDLELVKESNSFRGRVIDRYSHEICPNYLQASQSKHLMLDALSHALERANVELGKRQAALDKLLMLLNVHVRLVTPFPHFSPKRAEISLVAWRDILFWMGELAPKGDAR